MPNKDGVYAGEYIIVHYLLWIIVSLPPVLCTYVCILYTETTRPWGAQSLTIARYIIESLYVEM